MINNGNVVIPAGLEVTKKQCGGDFSELVKYIRERQEQYKDYEPDESEENGGANE